MLANARPQLAGARHGSVEVENRPGHADRVERPADSGERLFRLLDRVVTATQAGDVTDGAVGAREHDAARERDLDGDDEVEPVHEQRASSDVLGVLLACGAAPVLAVGADRSLEREALARFELVVVAYEPDRGRTRVAAVEQPGDLLRGRVQAGQLRRAEEAWVVQVRAAVAQASLVKAKSHEERTATPACEAKGSTRGERGTPPHG